MEKGSHVSTVRMINSRTVGTLSVRQLIQKIMMKTFCFIPIERC